MTEEFYRMDNSNNLIIKIQTLSVHVMFHFKTYLRLRLGRCSNLQSSYLEAVLA